MMRKYVRGGTSCRLYVCLLLLPLVLGCSVLFGPEDGELDENLGLWREAGIEDYTFRFRRICFCTATNAVVIEVRAGSVQSIVDAESGEPVDARFLTSYLTVDGLFEEIREAIDRDAHTLSVTYHQSLGYPTSIDIDYEVNTIDDEVSFRASELEESYSSH